MANTPPFYQYEGSQKAPMKGKPAGRKLVKEVQKAIPKHEMLGKIGRYLTDEEMADLTRGDEKSFRDINGILDRMPPTEALQVLAKMGKGHREWYQDARRSLKEKFGADAPRFIALLAATSSNKGVQENIRAASYIWKHYQELKQQLGQTPPVPAVQAMLRRINGVAVTDPNLSYARFATTPDSADFKNTLYALDPSKEAGDAYLKILGSENTHKIDSFRRNLLGNLMAVTNDTWAAKVFGVENKKHKGGVIRGYKAPSGPIYHAYSARTRQLAAKMGWEPAEVQAATWQALRQIVIKKERARKWTPASKEAYEASGGSPIPRNAVTAKGAAKSVTNQDITEGASFSNLLSDPEVVKHIGKSGELEQGDTPVSLKMGPKGYKEAKPLNPRSSVYSGLTGAEKKAVTPIMTSAQTMKLSPYQISRQAHHGTKVRYAAEQERPQDGSKAPPPMPSPITPNAPQAPISPPAKPQAGGGVMVSPNTETGLSFEQANQRRESGNHKALQKIIKAFSEQLGVKSKIHSAIGAWQDGAEDSVYQEMDHPSDPETTKYLGALYGQYAKQKQVLIFHHNPKGTDSLYQIELPQHVPMGKIHEMCLKLGIPFQTILPQNNKTTLVIADPNHSLQKNVAQLAEKLYATVSESPVSIESIGDSTGTDQAKALHNYRAIIDAYESKHPKGSGPAAGGNVQTQSEAPLGNNGRSGEARRYSQTGQKVRYSGVQAPAQGVVVRGIFYPGGKYIPQGELEKSNYNQYQQVGSRRNQLQRYAATENRRRDGSVCTPVKYAKAPGTDYNQLAVAAAGGDKHAQHTLFEQLQPQLYSFAKSKFPKLDPDDVAQMAMMNIWKHLQSGEFTPKDNFMSWAFTIADRRAKDSLGGKHAAKLRGASSLHDTEGNPIDLISKQPQPEQEAMDHERHKALEGAIGQLPDIERVAVQGTREGKPFREIGEGMGVHLVNAQRAAKKGIGMLRKQLEQYQRRK